MDARTLLLGLLLAWSGLGFLRAGDPSNLVGSDLSLKQAILRADVIVIGHFSFIGNGPNRDFAGEQSYENALIQTSEPLKTTQSGSLTVYYVVHPDLKEIPPVADTSYIIFVRALTASLNRVEMLLPATDDNIRKVKELIPLLAKPVKASATTSSGASLDIRPHVLLGNSMRQALSPLSSARSRDLAAHIAIRIS